MDSNSSEETGGDEVGQGGVSEGRKDGDVSNEGNDGNVVFVD